MNRINITEVVVNFSMFVGLQWLLNNKVVLFDTAFAYFYVAFLLLLPRTVGRVYQLLIAFAVGLSIDVFSNTPGLNAGACVTVVFFKDQWMDAINEDSKDFRQINIFSLGFTGFVMYALPLIFIHHLILFVIENGGFHLIGALARKVVSSSVLTLFVIIILEYLAASRNRV